MHQNQPAEYEIDRSTDEARAAVASFQATDAQLTALLDAIPDAMVAVTQSGEIWWLNQRAEQLFGYEPGELIGQDLEVLVPEGPRALHPELREGYTMMPQARQMALMNDVSALRKDGVQVPVEVALSPVRLAGTDLVLANIRDASSRRAASEQDRATAARFRAIFHEAPIGMHLVSLRPEDFGQVIEVNDALCRILGRSREELLKTKAGDHAIPKDRSFEGLRLMAAGRRDHEDFERRYRTGSGEQLWLHVKRSVVENADGAPSYAVCHTEDVTLRRDREAQLTHAATHDPLTGLPNRTLLLDRLKQQLAALKRRPGLVSAFYLDLDRFKAVNDEYGHQVGDDLLVEVASRLQSAIRPTDTAARMAGDEFVVLCGSLTEVTDVIALGERIVELLDQPYPLEADVRAGASVGVATTDDPAVAPDELLRRADKALYAAKAAGRGTVAHYRPEDD